MTQPDTPGRSKATVPVVVAVVAALVTGIMLLAPGLAGGSDGDGEQGTNEPSRAGGREALGDDDPLAALARREPEDPLAIGDVDAPVVIINYSEFQCPFCGKFARDTKPHLVERFVEDGTLRIEWRDFPYLGPESTTAAHAARAAAAQDGFWAFHDAMFDDQQPPNSGRLTEDYLVGVAGDAGLDPDRLRDDMRSREVADAVRRDFEEGQSIGVTGTPAFLVNGRPIIGAQPTDVFVAAVEQAADEAR
jgi:protein-disulfide isomerase